MLAYLGAMLAQLAGHVGPSGGYVGPACARFGASVGPLQSQDRKMGKPQSTANCGMFVGSASRGGLRQCHGHGGLEFKGLRLTAGRRPSNPSNLGTMLALCWAYVGPMLAHVKPSWSYVGAMFGPSMLERA